jgi:hypothetical protein
MGEAPISRWNVGMTRSPGWRWDQRRVHELTQPQVSLSSRAVCREHAVVALFSITAGPYCRCRPWRCARPGLPSRRHRKRRPCEGYRLPLPPPAPGAPAASAPPPDVHQFTIATAASVSTLVLGSKRSANPATEKSSPVRPSVRVTDRGSEGQRCGGSGEIAGVRLERQRQQQSRCRAQHGATPLPLQLAKASFRKSSSRARSEDGPHPVTALVADHHSERRAAAFPAKQHIQPDARRRRVSVGAAEPSARSPGVVATLDTDDPNAFTISRSPPGGYPSRSPPGSSAAAYQIRHASSARNATESPIAQPFPR